ncbi:MAG: hypothetical protein IT317_03055 [Anaerolineales bacterium]|nr:hypothetical protein [Anaerolineales bacterium]
MRRRQQSTGLAVLAALALAACVQSVGPLSESTGTSGSLPLAGYAALGGVASLRRHALDETIRPTDLHGTRYVGIGPDNEVYLVDWASGEQTQITNDGMVKGNAVLSDDYVAWITYTRLADQKLPRTHIYMLDRQTSGQRQITAWNESDRGSQRTLAPDASAGVKQIERKGHAI